MRRIPIVVGLLALLTLPPLVQANHIAYATLVPTRTDRLNEVVPGPQGFTWFQVDDANGGTDNTPLRVLFGDGAQLCTVGGVGADTAAGIYWNPCGTGTYELWHPSPATVAIYFSHTYRSAGVYVVDWTTCCTSSGFELNGFTVVYVSGIGQAG